MAAGDMTFIETHNIGGICVEFWEVQSNGTTDVVIYPKVHRVVSVSAAWGEDVGTTAVVPELVVDNSAHTVTVTINGAAADKKLYVTIFGTA